MAEVGIRAFKAELSRYLREVRRGKPVSITDRGQVIAEVTTPVSPTATKGRGVRQAADLRWRALVQAGVLRPAASTARPWASGRLVRAVSGTARQLLDADRAE